MTRNCCAAALDVTMNTVHTVRSFPGPQILAVSNLLACVGAPLPGAGPDGEWSAMPELLKI